MFVEFLLPNLIFIILVIGAMVWIFHVSRHMRTRKTFRWVGMLVLIPCATTLLFRHSFALSFVPNALQVTSVEYAQEVAMGFGPGANEAGVIVYPLRDSVVREIEKHGLQYFWQMPPNADQQKREWRGAYRRWQQTPVPPVTPESPRPGPPRLDMLDYVCKYLVISVDQAIVDDVNAMLNTPGNYYAYGRIGMIVVSPSQRRVVYLYNG